MQILWNYYPKAAVVPANFMSMQHSGCSTNYCLLIPNEAALLLWNGTASYSVFARSAGGERRHEDGIQSDVLTVPVGWFLRGVMPTTRTIIKIHNHIIIEIRTLARLRSPWPKNHGRLVALPLDSRSVCDSEPHAIKIKELSGHSRDDVAALDDAATADDVNNMTPTFILVQRVIGKHFTFGQFKGMTSTNRSF